MDSTLEESNDIPGDNGIFNPKTRAIRFKTGGKNLERCGQEHIICIRVPGPPQFLQQLGDTFEETQEKSCDVKHQQIKMF